jgi:enamine deaminase RidA (YjgF/YER057c/UK114 family)
MVVDELREVFSENCRPAVSFVETALVDDDAVVAMDAVAALRKSLELTGVRRLREPIPGGGSDYVPSAILPGGPIVYISGQAEKGELLEATQKTMESLHKTLAFLGLDSSHVVHIKAFVKPISRVNSIEQRDVQEVIAKFYEKDGLIPPMSFVEWTNASPIEIEMIAYGPKQPSAPAISSNVTYLTPPGMKASPVFSRVAVVEGGHRVYVSGLYGKPESSGGEQIRDIFTQLQGHLKSAGSDLAHMAKATYYVSNDDASKQLNLIRPNIYDPKRPPAASKAGVKGVGRPGCSITLDMIAATK